jgi:hypothetical protein
LFSRLFLLLRATRCNLPGIQCMAATKTQPQSSAGASADVVAWFAVLENARHRADFNRAAEAQRELQRLGVKVTYTPPGRKAVRDAR